MNLAMSHFASVARGMRQFNIKFYFMAKTLHNYNFIVALRLGAARECDFLIKPELLANIFCAPQNCCSYAIIIDAHS